MFQIRKASMPVGSTKAPPRQIIYLFVATILGFVAMYFLFTRTSDLAQSGEVQLSIGDQVFAPGNIDRLSEDIDRQQTPLFFGDVAGGDRDIFLQHTGDEPATGWFAFAVRPGDAPRDCFITWDANEQLFNYNCDDRTFPADGEGLFQYPVNINDSGEITIDLNAADRDAAVDTDSTDETEDDEG